jgi:hypothetical protein
MSRNTEGIFFIYKGTGRHFIVRYTTKKILNKERYRMEYDAM